MINFKPTYLYIKQHPVTGLKYFGKTCLENVFKYNGSGIYWKRHLKVHGNSNIKTIWHKLFINKDDCEEFALFFSEEANIVKSKLWANEQNENGLDGFPVGKESWNKGKKVGPCSEERKYNISKAKLGKKTVPCSDEKRLKISISNKGKPSKLKSVTRTDEVKKLISNSKKLQWANPEFRNYMLECRNRKLLSKQTL